MSGTKIRKAVSRAIRKFFAKLVDTDDVHMALLSYNDRRSVSNPKILRNLCNEKNPYFAVPSIGSQTRDRDDIVFVTSRFRSGSTALWNAFRQLDDITAYYEPFNERQFFNASLRGTRVDSTHVGVDDYWREYDRASGLTELYEENWIRRGLYMDENAWNPRMERFIERLVESADGRPVLQFNRIDFRLPWLRSRFPNASIIHLYRNPREQWCSFLINPECFPYNAASSEFRDHFYLNTWSRDLQHVMPFLRHDKIEHPYQLFYLLWKASYVVGRAHATTSIAFEDLVDDPALVLNSLVTKLGMSAHTVETMKATITHPKPERWPNYADAEWFERHEAICENQLDDFFL